jgi:hypothetical protein
MALATPVFPDTVQTVQLHQYHKASAVFAQQAMKVQVTAVRAVVTLVPPDATRPLQQTPPALHVLRTTRFAVVAFLAAVMQDMVPLMLVRRAFSVWEAPTKPPWETPLVFFV